jgi:hypothetical protein
MRHRREIKQISFWLPVELLEKLKSKLEQKKKQDPFLDMSKYLRQIIKNAVE